MPKKKKTKLPIKDRIKYKLYQGANFVNSLYDTLPMEVALKNGGRVKEKKKGKGMKGMNIKGGHKRPTKQGAGLTKKGVEKYKRQNPGSKLQTAVTEKNPKGKRAARRKSYCARSLGQMKKFPKAAKDPNSRLRQARRRWRC